MIRFLEEDDSALRRVVVHHGEVGDLTVSVDARDAVVKVEWGDTRSGGIDDEGLDTMKGTLERWFVGEDVEVTVAPRGLGSMALEVLRAIAVVRPGDVTGYSDIAMAAGYAKAVRAVATAVGRNPIPVVIPCHRVVPVMAARLWRRDRSALMSDARLLGRYTPDSSLKPRLLSYELGRWERGGGQSEWVTDGEVECERLAEGCHVVVAATAGVVGGVEPYAEVGAYHEHGDVKA